MSAEDRMIRIKRVYEAPARGDGRRILVERLWPRGLKKTELEIDDWAKDVAPSTQLRTWYGHDVARWPAFRQRYRAELRASGAWAALLAAAKRSNVTLLYSARDSLHNSAVVLRDFLARRLTLRRRDKT